MRITFKNAFDVRNAHLYQQFAGFDQRIGFGRHAVIEQPFGELIAYAQHRIEGGHRLLKNHRHFLAAQFATRLCRQRIQRMPCAVATEEINTARIDVCGIGQQSHHAQ